MKYVKLYTDALYAYKRLSDTEFGRAIRALLQYVEDGTEASLPGKESIMFDVLREQVERDKTVYNTRIENGSKGGRKPKSEKPKETESNRKNRTVNSVTETTYDKDKDIYIPPYNPPKGETEDDDDELIALSEKHNAVFDRARECGFDTNTATLHRLTEMISVHGADKVMSSLDDCVEHGAKSLAYLRKVLEGKPKPKGNDQPQYQRLFV